MNGTPDLVVNPDNTGAQRMLEGRRAIVTGASRGIGAEIARAMARAGAAVDLAARDQDALTPVAEGITAQGRPRARRQLGGPCGDHHALALPRR